MAMLVRGEARCVMVGLQMDTNGKELLEWAINRVTKQGDSIVAVNVCRDSGLKNTITTLSLVAMLRDFLVAYEGACNLKKVSLVGRVVRGKSIQKVLVNEAKLCAATDIVVGANTHISMGGSALVAKYCAKKLPPAISVITVQDGQVIFEKKATLEKTSARGPKPRRLRNILYKGLSMQQSIAIPTPNAEKEAVKESRKPLNYDFKNDEDDEAISNAKNHVREEIRADTQTSITVFVRQLPQPVIGWPLLRKAVQENIAEEKADGARRLSVVQWAMALPDRNFSSVQPLFQLTKELMTILDKNNSSCKWFHYEELLSSTNQFSSENLIGKGGTGLVYRGKLGSGKEVAIKLLQLSTESSRDFLQEVDIVTKLDHQHVVSLLGICVQKNNLISIFKYFVNGSLEEILCGKNVERPLPWDTRTKVAMGIAEALNYLHHGPQTVIHRDVKSSNILLDDKFEPQLSDFGLAIWAHKTSKYLAQNDIVGTFGYLAPEYFMYGKASHKIDVYAFGVVLLELITGRMAINDNNPKGQESLVMWATQVIENGNLMDLLDPKLDTNYDKDQMRRMILAASLCITRIPLLRPAIDKICSLLQGEDDIEKWICNQKDSMSDMVDWLDEEIYPPCSIGSLALINMDHNASVIGCEQHQFGSWQEYLRGRWSRSSSFN
ncbi:probable receptor-like protein kinase At1g30570 isoform X1 [Zingiber officinale]|nr:probable receptor-like protein kinase At1g30570 isoform X1 [Zingiber officinale]